MSRVQIQIASLTFVAEWQNERAPKTCAAFLARLPFENTLLQARWSGEAAWIPLGEAQWNVPLENATSYPAPGELLFYPGNTSETEILVPYGATRFASKVGQLAGNHFLTITEGREQLFQIGQWALHHGAQPIRFELISR